MSDLILVKSFKSRIEADLAKTLLDTNDIFCMVKVDDAGGAYPSLVDSSGAQIFVKKEDLEKVSKLLD